MEKIKAISLVSGGLDSILATKLILDQGIEVMAMNFLSPFCLCNKRGGCRYEAGELSRKLGIPLKAVGVHQEFLDIVKSPKHGYGSNLNPCIDCRIMMLKKAKEFMEKEGASFLITGEVLGQRPMSQNRNSLDLIEKESGLKGLILRPLCARLFPETIPEKMGWVKREVLMDISGRGRKPQLSLIKEFGIKDYPCAAGGCLLTDPAFCQRVKDLLRYGEFNLENIELLKVGRHFRLGPEAKLVVGRNETENNHLEKLFDDQDWVFMPQAVNGPLALGRGRGFSNQKLCALSSSIVCRYCDKNGKEIVDIRYKIRSSKDSVAISTAPLQEDRLRWLLI